MEKYGFLVTGGGGYIGSVLVPELLALWHRVTVRAFFEAVTCQEP